MYVPAAISVFVGLLYGIEFTISTHVLLCSGGYKVKWISVRNCVDFLARSSKVARSGLDDTFTCVVVGSIS